MELTDREIHLLARLARERGLHRDRPPSTRHTFDARSSTTPFKQDPRPLLRLHGIGGRIDYAWVAPVENWRALVGPEVSAEVDAIDEIESVATGRSSASVQ